MTEQSTLIKGRLPILLERSATHHMHEPEAATLQVELLIQRLGTREAGLSQEEVSERLRRHGQNSISLDAHVPFILRLRENFAHTMAILLWCGGLIGFLAQMPQIGIAIWMVNIVNGAFSFWQEYRAERATEALKKLLPTTVTVMREGRTAIVAATSLVPGDIILVSEGDKISADARLIFARGITIDQSTLTGESRPVRKQEAAILPDQCSHTNGAFQYEIPNLLFAGTSVLSGHGKAVVFATGVGTEFGRIARLTQSIVDQPSPLQKEMARVTRIVSALAVGIAAVMFALAATFTDNTLAQAFVFSMGMIVAFVPEGMVPTVTLSLAMAVQRMAGRNALVKRLSSVEALGCTQVICTDKTGTLTENKMKVTRCWAGYRDYDCAGAQIVNAKADQDTSVATDLQELLRSGILCNNASLKNDCGEPSTSGDPTEVALLEAAAKLGIDRLDEEQSLPRLHENPFDSVSKWMSTVHKSGQNNILYAKGSAERIIGNCTTILADGKRQIFDHAMKSDLLAHIDECARQGLRVIAAAQAEIASTESANTDPAKIEMTFLGFFAMFDPPRPEVRQAVAKCHDAGIKVVMITGDYEVTAEAVARQAGILSKDHCHIITGAQLNRMTDQELMELIHADVIFARVNPDHKLRIVQAFQRCGKIVAVTGDGVNDGPALKQADIGIAMGLNGTDVAREAADIILLDDNFASIVSAVEEGRAVYENIKKFAVYVFNSNMAEAVPFVVMLLSCGLIPLPLTVMQVLSVDLGTDMVPAIALGAEKPELGVMQQPPRSRKTALLSPALLSRALLWYGAIEAVAGMSCYFYANWLNGWPGHPLASAGTHEWKVATTMTLAGIVASQVGAVFCCRSERASAFARGMFSNSLILWGIAFELCLLLSLIYVPLLQGVFDTAALGFNQVAFVLAWTPAIILLDEIRKLIIRAHVGRIRKQSQSICRVG